MVLLLLLAVIVGFLVLGFVGWALWHLAVIAITGLVIGGLARLILPGRQPITITATILCGLVGSLIGGAFGHGFHLGGLATFGVEVGAALIVVALWSAHERRRPVLATRRHRVIDI